MLFSPPATVDGPWIAHGPPRILFTPSHCQPLPGPLLQPHLQPPATLCTWPASRLPALIPLTPHTQSRKDYFLFYTHGVPEKTLWQLKHKEFLASNTVMATLFFGH